MPPAISIFENGIVERPRESRRRTITAQLLAQFLGQYSGHLFCVIAADQFVRVLVAIVVLNRIAATVGQYDHAGFDNEAALNELARAVALWGLKLNKDGKHLGHDFLKYITRHSGRADRGGNSCRVEMARRQAR